MEIDSNSLQDELIDIQDFVVYTDDQEKLLKDSKSTIIVRGKEKEIKYKAYDPASNLEVIGQIARDFGPRVVQGTRIGGVLGNVIKFVSSQDGQELLRVVGDEAKKRFGGNNNSTKTSPSSGNNSTNFGGGKGKSKGKGMEDPGRNSAAGSVFTNMPPLSTSITTPISKRTLSEDLAQAKEEEPIMHITGARFALQVNEPDDVVYKWFNEVVAPDFQNLASLSVNYGINAESVFSTDNLITYMNSIAYALQVYYFYVSIIAYELNIPHNKNAGMKWLRNQITQEDMYALEALSRTLRTLPIPPRLNDVCFFLQQPFKNSDCAFSSICKIMPFGFNSTTAAHPLGFGTFDSTTRIVQHAINVLNTESLNVLSTKLANIVPDWLDITLYSAGPVPVYNLTLCDIWANLPTYSVNSTFPGGGRTVAYPSFQNAEVDGNNTNVHYVSKSDNPDAIAIALFGIFKRNLWTTGTADYDRLRPGLIGPEVSYYKQTDSQYLYCNNWSFFKKTNDTSAWFWPEFDDTNVIRNILITDIGKAAYFHNWECTFAEAKCRPAGYDNISYVTVENARYSAKQLVEWIMNLETMQVKAENAIKKRMPYNAKGSRLKTS